MMLYRFSAAVGLVVVTLLSSAARAQDFVRDSAPLKWIDPLLPEDLPEIKYPDYDTSLDKAEAQLFSGRYKLAVISLSKLKDLKPEQRVDAAVIKGRALTALGEFDDAIKALTDDSVAND